MASDTIEIENINTPGKTTKVGRDKFEAMREALLKVLTTRPPGMTAAEMKSALLPQLPEALFPQGETAGWWMKSVQLDQEAKGVIKRSETKPLRFYRIG